MQFWSSKRVDPESGFISFGRRYYLPHTGRFLTPDPAGFIDGVYAREGQCEKWQAIEAGGPRNIETVTETLTSEGFRSWEGNCDFETITEKEKGKVYEAKMQCIEGAAEWTETNTFVLQPSGGAMTVWIEG